MEMRRKMEKIDQAKEKKRVECEEKEVALNAGGLIAI